MARRWNTKASISMPAPAIAQPIRAPATPVSCPNRRGSENTPAPTMDPTTIAVSVATETFDVVDGVDVAVGSAMSPPVLTRTACS